ncbi:MAG TPA: hypothetical protein VGN48_13545 [Pedococcus sp.]|nr:hypothetical protein [Pedococcus sp.]
MVTLLLGVQGGDEESFSSLYTVTNPVLVRYLRVVSDADPATLALTTWSTLLDDLSVHVADDDDDWLELAVGTARASASAAAPMATEVSLLREPTPTPDPVDEAVAALRSCPPQVAEVLAMGVVAGLGRDSIARITGQSPVEVLALVVAGQTRLAMPLADLIAAMQTPGSPTELGDLPAVLPMFARQSHAPPQLVTTAPVEDKASVVDLLGWQSPAVGTSTVVLRRGANTAGSSLWARAGVGAAAWTLAVGGVAAAVAMIGVVPAVIHNLFGNGGNGPTVVAHGPVQPGGSPTPTGSGPGARSQQSVRKSGTPVPVGPATQPVGTTPATNAVVISVSAVGTSTATQLVVEPAVLTFSPTPSAPTTPAQPSPPPKPSAPPPGPSTGAGGGGTQTSSGSTDGRDHVPTSTGHRESRAVEAREKAQASARAKAAAAKEKAAREKAAKAKKAAAAKKAAKEKAAKEKAAKEKAAAAKEAKEKAASSRV